MYNLYNVNIDVYKCVITFDADYTPLFESNEEEANNFIDNINLDNLVLCIDEFINISNMYSDTLENHNYLYTSKNSTIILTKSTDENKPGIVSFRIEDRSLFVLTDHLKYLKLVVLDQYKYDNTKEFDYKVAEGIYYSPLVTYEAEMYNITKYCSNCLDDHNMQLIAYVTFRKQLLDEAIELRHYKEAMALYADVTRLLGVIYDKTVFPKGWGFDCVSSDMLEFIETSSCSCGDTCCTCNGNSCSTCSLCYG